MRRISILLVALLLLPLGVMGCSQTERPPEAPSAATTKTVTLLMPHLNNPFMNQLQGAVKKYAGEADFELIIHTADNNVATQISQLEAAVDSDLIILAPCSNTELASAVAKVKAAGVPVVTLHERISTQDSDCVSFVGPDFTNGGRQEMERAMADLPDGGSPFAFIYGAQGHTAQIDITKGYTEALQGKTDKYPVIAEGYGDWATEAAQNLVSGWLADGKEPDAIVCNNDGMAAGALAAVKKAGLAGKIHLYGLDAQENILDAIQSGEVNATIYTDFDTEAKKCVEVVSQILSGAKVDASYPIPMILITAENVKEFRS